MQAKWAVVTIWRGRFICENSRADHDFDVILSSNALLTGMWLSGFSTIRDYTRIQLSWISIRCPETSDTAARKAHRVHIPRNDVADPSPSSYACGGQSHIPAKTRNVLIPSQKQSVPCDCPKNAMMATGAGKVRALTGAGKFGGSSVSFSTAFIAPQEFTMYETLGTRFRNNPLEFAATLANKALTPACLRRR